MIYRKKNKIENSQTRYCHSARDYLDKIFAEKIIQIRTEFQGWFDNLEKSFPKSLSEKLKFLRRDLEGKNKIISNWKSKKLSNALQKDISPWKPNISTPKNCNFT